MSTTRRRALITGATAGIGYEYARQLAAKDHDLILVARDADRLQRVATELSTSTGVFTECLPADLSTLEGIGQVAAWLAEHPVDLLVHNAGFGTKGLLHRTDGSVQAAMVNLHVVAADRLVRAALPAMLARRSGGLIVVSSVASFTISSANVNYTATKAYQRVYMESLALETEGTGVRVQALCPGFTRTEFHDRARMNMQAIPFSLWMTAESVVRTSLSSLERGGPVVVVPGLKWKAIVALLRYLPRWMLRGSARRYQKTRT